MGREEKESAVNHPDSKVPALHTISRTPLLFPQLGGPLTASACPITTCLNWAGQ